MARRSKRDKSQLGDSWVVNDSSDADDDGDDSGYKDKDGDMQQSHTSKMSGSKQGGGGGRHGGNGSGEATPRRRSSRAASKEPEFIMPSIYEDGMARSPTRGERGRGGAGGGQGARRRSNRAGVSSNGIVPEREGDGKMAPRSSRGDARTAETFAMDAMENVLAVVKPIAVWILDVAGGAFKALKTPISYAIALYVILGLLAFGRNLLTQTIYTALSPICRIPGSSLLNLPMCQTSYPRDQDPSTAPVEFDELMTVQSKFEDILEQSAAGVSLPQYMKRGETSIRDLRQIVRFSNLQSRNELVLEFDGFVETARIASYDLQRFNSHVGRAVDNVIATARYTRRVLDQISDAQSSRGLIPAFINDRILAPFQPMRQPTAEAALLDQYISHTRIVEEEINRLIDEAQALLLVLTNLEDRLEVIHGISMREGMSIKGTRDEVLSQLWTLLGGNRGALGKYNSQLNLLRQVSEYRKTAWAHISGTILRLQAMGAELEELRERVASAEVLGTGVVPLSVHIENIEAGVERLEGARANAKTIQDEHLKRVLERGKDVEGVRLVEG